MFNTKESKVGLVRSLITSAIFLIFLKPIVEFVWNILIRISNNTYSYFIDSLYKNASLGQRNWVDFLILLFLSMGVITSINTKFINTLNRVSFINLKLKIKNETDIDKLSELRNKIKNKSKILSGLYKVFFLNKWTSIPLLIL